MGQVCLERNIKCRSSKKLQNRFSVKHIINMWNFVEDIYLIILDFYHEFYMIFVREWEYQNSTFSLSVAAVGFFSIFIPVFAFVCFVNFLSRLFSHTQSTKLAYLAQSSRRVKQER